MGHTAQCSINSGRTFSTHSKDQQDGLLAIQRIGPSCYFMLPVEGLFFPLESPELPDDDDPVVAVPVELGNSPIIVMECGPMTIITGSPFLSLALTR